MSIFVGSLPLCTSLPLSGQIPVYLFYCMHILPSDRYSHLLVGLVQASILSLFVSILPVSVHMVLCVKRGPTGANKRFCTCLVHDGDMRP